MSKSTVPPEGILENLLGNTIDHGGADVTIRVGGLDGGSCVEDDGPGVPAEDRDPVFESGYSTADDGTEFGLGVVEEIAETHGRGAAVAEGSDGGARFEIAGVEPDGAAGEQPQIDRNAGVPRISKRRRYRT